MLTMRINAAELCTTGTLFLASTDAIMAASFNVHPDCTYDSQYDCDV